jgi:mutator protein MutT
MAEKLNKKYIAGLLCIENGEVYLSKRINKNKLYWKKYQAIGGKIEFGETPEQACIREIREESGIYVDEKQLKYVGQQENTETGRSCELYMIEIGELQRPKLIEPANNTKWYKMTGKEMYERELTPILIKFKREILKELGYKYED